MPEIGGYDAILNIGTKVDTSQLYNQVANLSNKIPPLNLKTKGFGALGTISRDANEFSKSLASSNARVIAFGVSAGAMYSVVRAFREVTKATVETQKALTDINVVLQLSQTQLTKFSSNLFEVANKTGQSFATAAKAALEFSRQGLTVEETLRRTSDALSLARFTGLAVEDSILAITTALNSFDDAALNSTKVLEKISAVDVSFAVSGRDLAQGLTRVGSIARDAGVEFDKLLGILTSAKVISGRTGEVVGTAVGTIFQRLGRQQNLETLEKLGVVTKDINGDFLTTDRILINLSRTFNTLSEAQQNQITQMVGGVRQANVLRAILSDLSKENSIFSKATLEAANASGFAAIRTAELNKTLSASINELFNNLTKISAGFGNLTIKPVVENLTGIFKKLTGALESEDPGVRAGLAIGEGILKGLGNYISGPGLLAAGALAFKLFGNFASFATKSFTHILEATSREYTTRVAIQDLLARQPALEQAVVKGALNQAEIQAVILGTLQKQSVEYARQGQLFSAARALVSTGDIAIKGGVARLASKTKALGHIPEEVQEKLGAYAGGYTPGDVRKIYIPKLGPVIYNNAEKIKRFPGLGPAIIPPQASEAGINYKKEFQAVHLFNPYKSEGLVPNYAGFIGPTKRLLQMLRSEGVDFNRWGQSPLFRRGLPPEIRSEIQVPARRHGGDPTDSPIFALFHEAGHYFSNKMGLAPSLMQYMMNPKLAARSERLANNLGFGLTRELGFDKELRKKYIPYAQKYYSDYTRDSSTGKKYRGIPLDAFDTSKSSGFLPYVNKGLVPNFATIPKQFAYHVTTLDRAYDIAQDKLRTFKPWYGTEQNAWPDGSTKKRAYFSLGQPQTAFQPEGKLAILRTPITKAFKTESTGDIYIRKPLDAAKLELQIGDNWVSLKKHFGLASSGFLPYANKGLVPNFALVRGYHGTAASFDKFDITKSKDIGIHFGSTPEQANNILRGFGQFGQEYVPGARIIPALLNINKPLQIRDIFSRIGESFTRKATDIHLRSQLPLNQDELQGLYANAKTLDGILKLAGRGSIKSGYWRIGLEKDPAQRVKFQGLERGFYKILEDSLKRNGYDSLVYQNKIESKGLSYSILDEKQILPYVNKGLIPNYANLIKQVRPLGSGAFGDFYQYIKRPTLGYKEFFGNRQEIYDQIEKEFGRSILATARLSKDDFVTTPRVFGTLQGALRKQRIGKEVVSGGDFYKIQNKISTAFANSSDPFISSKSHSILTEIAKLAYNRAAKRGIDIFDRHFGNLGAKGNLFNFVASSIQNKEYFNDPFLGSNLGSELRGNKLVSKLKRSGIKISLLDLGRFSSDIFAKGLIPNYASFDTNLLKQITQEYGIFGKKLEIRKRNEAQIRSALSLSQKTGIKPEELLMDKYFQDEFRKFVPSFNLKKQIPNYALFHRDIGFPPVLSETLKKLEGKSLRINYGFHARNAVLDDIKKYGDKIPAIPKNIQIRPSEIVEVETGASQNDIIKLLIRKKGEKGLDQVLALSVGAGDSAFLKTVFHNKSTDIHSTLNRARYGAAEGYIPNFNAISSAITREVNAGVPPSKIKIGQSPIIKSAQNPLGLGVYNTRDEPGGIHQGISRVAAMGLDPKKAGLYAKGRVPNFAPLSLFQQPDFPDIGKISDKYIHQLDQSIAALSSFVSKSGLGDVATINKLKSNITKIANEAGFTSIQMAELRRVRNIEIQTAKKIFEAPKIPPTPKPPGKIGTFFETPQTKPTFPTVPTRLLAPEQKPPYFNQFSLLPSAIKVGTPQTGTFESRLQQILNTVPKKPPLSLLKNFEETGVPKGVVNRIGGTTLINSQLLGNQLFTQQLGAKDFGKNLKPFFLGQANEGINKYFEKITQGLDPASKQASLFRSEITEMVKSAGGTKKTLRSLDKILTEGTIGARTIATKLQEDIKIKQAKVEKLQTLESQAGIFTPSGRQAAKDLKKESPEAFRAFQANIANRAFLASIVLPVVGGVLQETIGNRTARQRGFGQIAAGVTNAASFAATGFALGGGPNPAGVAGAIIGGSIGLLLEAPKAFKAFGDTLPELQKRLEELKDTSQKTSSSLEGFITISEKLGEVVSTGGITRGEYQQIKNQQLVQLGQIPNISGRGLVRELVGGGKFNEARDVSARINYAIAQRIKLLQTQAQYSNFKQGFFGRYNTEELTQTDQKLFQDVVDLESQLNSLQKANFERFSEINKTGRERDINYLKKELPKVIEKFIQNSQFGQQFQQNLISLLGVEEPTTGKRAFDVLRTANITKGAENIQDVSKNIKDAFKGTGDTLESVFNELADSLNFTGEKFKNSPEILKALFEKIKEAFFPEYIQKTIDSLEKIDAANFKLRASLIALNATNFESQRRFDELGTTIEKLGIEKISKLTENLRKTEITQATTNQIVSFNQPGERLKNLFNLQQTTTTNRNQAQQSTEELSFKVAEDIFNNLSDTRKELTEGVQKNLIKLFKDSPKKILEEITGVINTFESDFKNVTENLKTGKVDERTINDFIEKGKERLQFFEKFQKLEVLPLELQTALEQAGYKKERFTKADKEIAGFTEGFIRNKLPGVFSEKELTDISNIPVKNLQSLQAQSETASEVFRKLLSNLYNNSKNFVVTTRQISADLEKNNNIAYTQFQENKRLIDSQFAIQQELIRRTGEIDVSVIAKQAELSRQQLGVGRARKIQLNQQSGLANTAGTLISTAINQNPTIGTFGLNIENLDVKLPELIDKYKKQIGDIQQIFGPKTEEEIQNLENAQDILKALIILETTYASKKAESNEITKQETKDLKYQLALASDRLEEQKRINEENARTGDFTDIRKNLGNTFFSGFDFGNKDFFNELSNDVADFGTEFKQAFKDGFAEAATGATSFNEALRNIGLTISKNILTKISNLALDTLFGAAATGARNLFNIPQKGVGGLINKPLKYAKGGYVNFGSGTKDDVPAMLGGGEFVLNRNSTSRLGKSTLDILNEKPEKITDLIKASSNRGLNVLLANEYFGYDNKKRPTRGELNVSPLLSDLALTEENNPQNILRFARERYFVDLKQYQKEISKANSEYEKQKITALYMAYINAAVAGVGQYAGQLAASRSANFGAFNAGYGPVSNRGASSLGYGNELTNQDITNTIYGFGSSQFGSIRGRTIYASGGRVFGGDNARDNIPALLMGGEFVLNKTASNKIGSNRLNYMNKTGKLPGYAEGGMVGDIYSSYTNTNVNDGSFMSKYFDELISVSQQIRDNLNSNNNNTGTASTNSNSGGININNAITVNISDNGKIQTNTTTTTDDNRKDKKNKQEDAKQIGELVNNLITQKLVSESRNGGILYEKFKTR